MPRDHTSVIRALAQDSDWVKNHEHIFVLGPTGVGKSYVASALAQKAYRDGYPVYYARTAALFRDLNLARADGSLRQLLKRLDRIDVLASRGRLSHGTDVRSRTKRLLRDRRRSLPDTFFDSDLATAGVQQAEQIGDPTLADSFLDRLVRVV